MKIGLLDVRRSALQEHDVVVNECFAKIEMHEDQHVNFGELGMM